MTDTKTCAKTFTVKQANKILARAVTIQAKTRTLDELRETAQEAGVESRWLDQAIAEAERPVWFKRAAVMAWTWVVTKGYPKSARHYHCLWPFLPAVLYALNQQTRWIVDDHRLQIGAFMMTFVAIGAAVLWEGLIREDERDGRRLPWMS